MTPDQILEKMSREIKNSNLGIVTNPINLDLIDKPIITPQNPMVEPSFMYQPKSEAFNGVVPGVPPKYRQLNTMKINEPFTTTVNQQKEGIHTKNHNSNKTIDKGLIGHSKGNGQFWKGVKWGLITGGIILGIYHFRKWRKSKEQKDNENNFHYFYRK